MKATIKRDIFAASPTLTAMVGVAGAVLFTTDITLAAVAAVITVVVLAGATAIFSVLRRYTDRFGEPAGYSLFFFSAAVLTAILSAVVAAVLSDTWSELFAFAPLFAVGGLTGAVWNRVSANENDVVTDVLRAVIVGVKYAVLIVLFSVLRAVLSIWMAFFATVSGGLLLLAIISAAYIAVYARIRHALDVRATADETVEEMLAAMNKAIAADTADTDEDDDAVEGSDASVQETFDDADMEMIDDLMVADEDIIENETDPEAVNDTVLPEVDENGNG